VRENVVVVFSKTYCPYCKRTKTALTAAGIAFQLFELDLGIGRERGWRVVWGWELAEEKQKLKGLAGVFWL
jgi:hypothetical protein